MQVWGVGTVHWKRWSDLAGENGWRPIYSKVHEESSPWMFPVYVDSPRARENLVSRGLKKGFLFAPWPALPSEILGSDQVALRRWGRLVCLPLDREPPDKTLFSLWSVINYITVAAGCAYAFSTGIFRGTWEYDDESRSGILQQFRCTIKEPVARYSKSQPSDAISNVWMALSLVRNSWSKFSQN